MLQPSGMLPKQHLGFLARAPLVLPSLTHLHLAVDRFRVRAPRVSSPMWLMCLMCLTWLPAVRGAAVLLWGGVLTAAGAGTELEGAVHGLGGGPSPLAPGTSSLGAGRQDGLGGGAACVDVGRVACGARSPCCCHFQWGWTWLDPPARAGMLARHQSIRAGVQSVVLAGARRWTSSPPP